MLSLGSCTRLNKEIGQYVVCVLTAVIELLLNSHNGQNMICFHDAYTWFHVTVLKCSTEKY